MALAVIATPILARKYIGLIKPSLEAKLSSIMNAEVRIGSISARLLPLPVVDVSELTATRQGAQAFSFRIPAARLRADLSGLLRGNQPLRAVEISGGEGSFVFEGRTHSLREFSFNTRVSALQDAYLLDGPSFSGTLEGRAVEGRASRAGPVYPDFTVAAEGLELHSGNIALRGNIKETSPGIHFSLSTNSASLVDLSRLVQPFLSSPLPEANRGKLSMALEGNIDDEFSINGSANISGFFRAENSIQFSSLAVSGLNVTSRAGETTLSALVDMRSFGIVYRIDRYHSEKTAGRVEVRMKNGEATISSPDLEFEGFSFSDETTALDNVKARLNDVRVTAGSRGVRATLGLAGGPITLSHPNITISGARSVRSPITIDVPASGGYSVKGPVTVEGADLAVLDHKIENTSGHVDMLVSGPLKRFISSDLSGTSSGRTLHARTNFTMLPTAYDFGDTAFSLGNGSLNGMGKLQRGSDGSFDFHARAQKFPVHDAAVIIGMPLPSSSEVFLENLEGSVKGHKQDYRGTLSGEGSFRLLIPRPGDFSLGQAIAGIVSSIPFVQMGSRKAQEEDAETITSNFTIRNGTTTFSNISVLRRMYTLQGSGTMDRDLKVDGTADLLFLELTSDRNSRAGGKRGPGLSVPLKIKGRPGNIEVSTDKPELMRNLTGISLLKDVARGTVDAGKAVTGAVGDALGGNQHTHPPQ